MTTNMQAERTPSAFERVAMAKVTTPGWRWFRAELIEGGFLLTGGVPVGEWQSGPRKGRPKWGKVESKVFVSDAEVQAERERYERDEGKCHQCYGKGETVASAGVSGTTYRSCSRCKGAGKPPA